jgi:protein-L-isoaspartate O-methyltransferase
MSKLQMFGGSLILLIATGSGFAQASTSRMLGSLSTKSTRRLLVQLTVTNEATNISQLTDFSFNQPVDPKSFSINVN